MDVEEEEEEKGVEEEEESSAHTTPEQTKMSLGSQEKPIELDQPTEVIYLEDDDEENDEGDEGEVARAFAVVRGGVGVQADGFSDEWVVGIEGVGEEERGGQRVRRVGVDEVGGYGYQHEEEGEQPCVADAGAFEFREGAADGAAFGAAGLVGFLGEEVSCCRL